jgi:hypothetical protein
MGEKSEPAASAARAPSLGEGAVAVSLRHLARLTFVTFLFTFIAARVLVILIMTRKIPDLFLHLGQTHIHHLNYGIFLLSAVGAVLVFVQQPSAQLRKLCAVLYGFGMALTFDEFGMWLHLGGGYWQRASFDAVVVLLGFFGVIAYAPALPRMRAHHWATGLAILVSMVTFYGLLFKSVRDVGQEIGPRLERIEEQGPQ